jgi:hypothetical protein
MAISVDTVYQKVLVLANKEQRGYITPQEFNLFANIAQMEILNQYFYDLNQFDRLQGNNTEYSDMLTLIDEKISVFKKDAIVTVGTSGGVTLPNDLYRIASVHSITLPPVEFQKITHKELALLMASPLTIPTIEYPVYREHGQGVINFTTSPPSSLASGLYVFPTNYSQVFIDYIIQPKDVSWDYVVLNEKALYNSTTSVNFELHPSEEIELVYKILKLGGIAIKRDDIMRAGQGLESLQVQQEKQ